MGPVAEDDLRALFARGVIAPDDAVWTPGAPGWIVARSLPLLRPAPQGPPARRSGTAGLWKRLFGPALWGSLAMGVVALAMVAYAGLFGLDMVPVTSRILLLTAVFLSWIAPALLLVGLGWAIVWSVRRRR